MPPTASKVRRIAMWSGPRNISTALMRSFENRQGCKVVDEPFYAHFLAKTGMDHPGRETVLADQPHDARDVIDRLMVPLGVGVQLQYQKLMSHHVTEETPLDWTADVSNCFLLREPRAVISSYIKQRENPTPDDLGLRQLCEIFDYVVKRQTAAPIVIDSDDVLSDPRGLLTKLCHRLGIAFETSMLEWPSGSRASDGAWAPWWYANVEKSMGFESRPPFDGELPVHLEEIAQEVMPYYQKLAAHKLV